MEGGFQGGRHGANGEEGIFENGRLFAGRLDELKEERHDAVGKRLDLVAKAADGALYSGMQLSKSTSKKTSERQRTVMTLQMLTWSSL